MIPSRSLSLSQKHLSEDGSKAPIGAVTKREVAWLPRTPSELSTFTGRFDELLALHSLLVSDKVGMDTGRIQRLPVSVTGMGGVGKTALVQHYVDQFSNYWPVVVRVNAAGDRFGHRIGGDVARAAWLDVLAGELQTLREGCGQSESQSGGESPSTHGEDARGDVLALARRRVDIQRRLLAKALPDVDADLNVGEREGQARQVLWWVDDVPDGLGVDLDRLSSPCGGGATVFTTRNMSLKSRTTELVLEPFPADGFGAGVVLLAKHRPGGEGVRQLDIPPNELPAMQEINRLLGGLPLALDVTGAWVGMQDKRWPDELEDLQADSIGLDIGIDTDGEDLLPTGHTPSVMATFAQSLHGLAQQAPGGMRALAVCAILGAGQPVPRPLLSEVLTDGQAPLTRRGVENLLAVPLRLRLAIANDATVRVHELISNVAKHLGTVDAEISPLWEVAVTQIESLATDPQWVIGAILKYGLPTVTLLFNAHDPNAPLARIVRAQAHNLTQSTTSRSDRANKASTIATLLAWEALRQEQKHLYAVFRSVIEESPGYRFLPISTSDRTDPRLLRILTGHADWVNSLALVATPHGQLVAVSGSGDTTVRVWDVEAGIQLGETCRNSTKPVLSAAVAVDRDGRLVPFSGGTDGTVEVWDLESGLGLGLRHFDASYWVHSVALAPARDGRLVAVSGGDDGAVRVWDMEAGRQLGELWGHTDSVRSVALAAARDGRLVAVSGGNDGTVLVWDVESGTQLGEPLDAASDCVFSVALAADRGGRLVAVSGSTDGTVRVWDVEAGVQLGEPLRGHTDRVLSVAVAGDGDGRLVAVSGGMDCTARVWDLETGDQVGGPLVGHEGPVRSVALAADRGGQLVAVSGGSDTTVRVWGVKNEAQISEPIHGATRGPQSTEPRSLKRGDQVGHIHLARSVALAADRDGRLVAASGGDDGMVRVWDVEAGIQLGGPLPGRTEAAMSVAFANEIGGRLISGDTPPVNSVALAADRDGRLVAASAGDDGWVRVWDVEAGTQLGGPLTGRTKPVISVSSASTHHGRLRVASGNPRPVRSVALAADRDGRLVAVSGGDDGMVRVWDVEACTQLGGPLACTQLGGPLRDQTDRVFSVALAADRDGRLVAASGGDDGMVRVWDVEACMELGEPLRGHTDRVFSVALAADRDGRLVAASGGDDGMVRVWDVESGNQLGEPLDAATDYVLSVALAADRGGRLVAVCSGTYDTAQVWDVLAGEQLGEPLRGHKGWVDSVALATHSDASEMTIVALAGGDWTAFVIPV